MTSSVTIAHLESVPNLAVHSAQTPSFGQALSGGPSSGVELLLNSAASGGGVNIDLDSTFTLQMLLFMFLVVALKPLLFDPLLKVFEERERRTEGAKAEAREMQREAGALLLRYEGEIARVSQVASEERERTRTETAKLEAQILAEAREETAAILERGRAEIEKQVQEVRAGLSRQSEQLARDLAAQALGRQVQ